MLKGRGIGEWEEGGREKNFQAPLHRQTSVLCDVKGETMI